MSDSERPGAPARIENLLSIVTLALMALLPLIETFGRKAFGGGISGSIPATQHLTLWITFLGAALAAREKRLLALSTATFLPEAWRPATRIFTAALGAGISAALALASWELVSVERESTEMVAFGIPVWAALAIMPAGFAVISLRLIWQASQRWVGRALASFGLLIPAILGSFTVLQEAPLFWPGVGILLIGTALGLPIFAAIGGSALLLFWLDFSPLAVVPGETYRLAASPMLPAIPLFTLGGYFLAEGGSDRRLMRLFQAFVGWMPGGLAIVTTLVLAFFTPLTGASGVTILSMGGLILPVLMKARYPESTSLGLVTVSGSIGLLFPPSLPVILYAFYAEQPIEKLFVGGLIPGVVLVVFVALWAAHRGWRNGAATTPFDRKEALAAIWGAKWEVLMPVVILGGIFGGFTTLVEAAALTVLYAFVVECVIFREIDFFKDLPNVFVESATMVGGFMIILGVALGFTNFLIFQMVPEQALDWVRSHIESPWVFLLALNLFLIVIGALMDIYSAIVVVVPMIAPIAASYGIDPVHLGIIFLANMELGYLMPPMGENLFLSSYRFDKSLPEVYRSVLPYTFILLIAVLLITFIPAITLIPASWVGP